MNDLTKVQQIQKKINIFANKDDDNKTFVKFLSVK